MIVNRVSVEGVATGVRTATLPPWLVWGGLMGHYRMA